MQLSTSIALTLALLPCLGACNTDDEETRTEVAEAPAAPAAPEAPAPVADARAVPAVAAIGQPAPDFLLSDLDGNEVRLSDHFAGTVVLEWFNPGCPFVVRSHTTGELASWPNEAGVTWYAINSGATGKQGNGVELNRQARAKWKMKAPILLDEDGTVGRAYGAKTTPHKFVIHDGVLVYAGAIDDDVRGDKGDARVNYVKQALAELAADKPVSVPETKSYGCSVKY